MSTADRDAGALLRVEVVYALPDSQTLIELRLPAGSSVADAVTRSGVLERHPEIDWPANPAGIWNRRASPADRLRDGDRVELYRPLRVSPAEARRLRARRAQAER
jgi:putative ubiquitin-RnfH superfamily antitoxin RatB of RatAB toxin-antitoxin module